MQPCTTIERPITSQTFNCSDTTWNVALPFLSAATVAMYPAIVLLDVLYTSPQLWRRGENGGEEGREAEMGKGGEGRVKERRQRQGWEEDSSEKQSLRLSTHLAHPSERSPYWCTWMACCPGVRPSTVPSTTHCSGVTCTILTSPLTPPPPCSIATAAPWWDEEGAVCVCVCGFT